MIMFNEHLFCRKLIISNYFKNISSYAHMYWVKLLVESTFQAERSSFKELINLFVIIIEFFGFHLHSVL